VKWKVTHFAVAVRTDSGALTAQAVEGFVGYSQLPVVIHLDSVIISLMGSLAYYSFTFSPQNVIAKNRIETELN